MMARLRRWQHYLVLTNWQAFPIWKWPGLVRDCWRDSGWS